MSKNKLKYLLSWIAISVLLSASIGIVALTWNQSMEKGISPLPFVLIWIVIAAAGIYLFILASGKIHIRLVEEEKSSKNEIAGKAERRRGEASEKKDPKKLEAVTVAKKLVRRLSACASMEDMGRDLVKNLAGELEIMSAVFYLKKGENYEVNNSYALISPMEQGGFMAGEGLPGQVARSGQIRMLTKFPDAHLEVYSGLGKAKPAYLAMVPFMRGDECIALLECSGFKYAPHDIELMFRIFSRDYMENREEIS